MVAGIEVSIAIECKRHQRRVNLDTVDQFIGKLLDIGAGYGALYSYAGFTDAAVTRAEFSTNPRVLTIALETPEGVLRSAPGFPAALLEQDMPPLWTEELQDGGFASFVESGSGPGDGSSLSTRLSENSRQASRALPLNALA
jgi:hypothetical protein